METLIASPKTNAKAKVKKTQAKSVVTEVKEEVKPVVEVIAKVDPDPSIEATNKTLIALSRKKLKSLVPSAFQKSAHEKMSKHYQFISTANVIKLLEKAGFIPFTAAQIRFRKENINEGYQFHTISFYHPDLVILNKKEQIEEMFEISVSNSHNGYSKFSLHGSFYRLACDNGMLCMTNDLGHLVTRHSGDSLKIKSDELLQKLIEQFDLMCKNVKSMKSRQLTEERKVELATRMAEARAFKQEGKFDYNAEDLLRLLRKEDKGNSLWKVYNVIQEKLIKGYSFAEGLEASETDKKAARKLRAITHFQAQMDLNKEFFKIASEFKSLKK